MDYCDFRIVYVNQNFIYTSGTFPASPGSFLKNSLLTEYKDEEFFSLSIETTLDYSIQVFES